ncbi:MAG: nucleotidyltransferase family protein [Bacteroidota bacterium]
MQAMIFAAGLGSRLRPLTNDCPKALVEVGGHPLLYWVIHRLKQKGYSDLVINIHHFGELILRYLSDNQYFGCRIAISDERDQVLETGGGLKKAAALFNKDEPILIHNVDILSDIDLSEMRQQHLQSGALATLAVKQRTTSRYLRFNDSLTLSGWKNIKTGEVRMSRKETASLHDLAFSGIHMVDPRLLEMFILKGKFSIIDTYLRLAKTETIQGFRHDDSKWLDVGKPENLALAETFVS